MAGGKRAAAWSSRRRGEPTISDGLIPSRRERPIDQPGDLASGQIEYSRPDLMNQTGRSGDGEIGPNRGTEGIVEGFRRDIGPVGPDDRAGILRPPICSRGAIGTTGRPSRAKAQFASSSS